MEWSKLPCWVKCFCISFVIKAKHPLTCSSVKRLKYLMTMWQSKWTLWSSKILCISVELLQLLPWMVKEGLKRLSVWNNYTSSKVKKLFGMSLLSRKIKLKVRQSWSLQIIMEINMECNYRVSIKEGTKVPFPNWTKFRY